MLKNRVNKMWRFVKVLQRLSIRTGRVVWNTLWRFQSNERRRDAAALTYTTLFALVPVLTVMYAVMGIMPSATEWREETVNRLLMSLMPGGSEQISAYLLGFSQQARSLTWIGVVFLFVTAFMLLRTIEQQFNRIWVVNESRSGLYTFVRYWAVISLGPILLALALMASSMVSFSDALWGNHWLWDYVPWALSSVALTMLYVFVPNCPVPWRNALIAAMVIALLFELGKFLFANILKLFPSYQLIYGAFAMVPLFLLWIFWAWMFVLLGAELSYALSHYTERSADLPPLWRRVRVLQVLWQAQQRGRLLAEARIVRRVGDLTPVQVRSELKILQEQGVATRTQEGQWLLVHDMHQWTLARFLASFTLEELLAPLPDALLVSDKQRKQWQAWQATWQAQSAQLLDVPMQSLLANGEVGVAQPKDGLR